MNPSTEPAVRATTLPLARAPRWTLKQNWERIVSIVLLLPSVVALGIFVYAFIGSTAFVSFTRWEGAAPDLTWVGLRNYERLFLGSGTDALRFHIDIRNEIGFTVLFLASCIVIGFGLASLLDRHIRAEGLFRGVFLFPNAIAFIVTGVAWRWILTPGDVATGPVGVNLLLDRVGLGFLKSQWFTDPTVFHISADSPIGHLMTQIGLGFLASTDFGYAAAITSLLIAATWQFSGYTMALYLAGLRSIPDELREAARIDGASEWQVQRYVVLPLLKPVTLTVVIILGHISLKIYDLVVAMTGGVSAGFATDVPALNMWKTTFDATLFAQGAAIAMILLVLVATLIIPYLNSQMRAETQV
jgi:glucose/mannose transport system permease protein